MESHPTVNIITLGCAKNLVDSEYLSMQLKTNGFQVVHEGNMPCDVTIINTCGFINDAKQESVETILEYTEQRQQGHTAKVYVMGCLSQRYREELAAGIPEVNAFFGINEQKELLNALNARYNEETAHQRILGTPSHYAFLKIAEGCNRKCSFCSIPLIKGSYVSKPQEEIEKEARFLADKGVREVNLIAQDLSYYGYDRYKQHLLPELVQRLDQLQAFGWIRLLYTYPAGFPVEILDVMAESPHICNYLDIPVQHIADRMLKRMRRGHNRKQTYQIIELIKKKIPGITLRTTLLVGHPGETNRDFSELMEFVREVRFDRLGVFAYSEEEGTHSARTWTDDIPEHVKQERVDELMGLQQEISSRKNHQKVGSTLRVLIDDWDEQYYYGRSEADAPEVDNGVLLAKAVHPIVEPGRFYDVTITEASDYDLYGKVVES